jgi:hypothetical protein
MGTPFRPGNRYGKLVAVHVVPSPSERKRALFKCDCGGTITPLIANVQRGNTRSCGCLKSGACRLPDGEAQLRYFYGRTKAGAKRRGYAFDLTLEQIKAIITQPCLYCGARPVVMKQKTYATGLAISGIDRRDNRRGYTVENAVPCCPTCNVAKAKMSEQDFKNWLSRVYRHYVIG